MKALKLIIAILLLNTVTFIAFTQCDIDTIRRYQKISKFEGNFIDTSVKSGGFGASLTRIGDLDNDGIIDIALGSPNDNDGGKSRGAVWILFMQSNNTVKSYKKISDLEGNFKGILDNGDRFGRSVSYLGDLNRDGIEDLVVGAETDDDGGSNRGAVWILFLNKNGTVKSHQKISKTEGNFDGKLDSGDQFGRAVACLGDVNKDGIQDIAVGSWSDDDGASATGAVWILFLNKKGKVKSHQKISATQGNFTGRLDSWDRFGQAVSYLGDLNKDGIMDLAVGQYHNDDGGKNKGAVWILFLNIDGTVKYHQKISSKFGNFSGKLNNEDYFGVSVSSFGDLNNDSINDLCVGAYFDDDGSYNRGAVWILYLDTNGTVKSHQKISDTRGKFEGRMNDGDQLGTSVAVLGDINNDNEIEIGIGASGDNDGGAIWIVSSEITQVVERYFKKQSISICEGDSILFNNNYLFSSGIYYDSSKSKFGCDSIVELNLKVKCCSCLIAYYPFSGNALDKSGNNLNGNVYSASLTTDRFNKANSAYYFNGLRNCYIRVPNNELLKLKFDFSLSFWVYRTRTGRREYIIGKGRDVKDNYGLMINKEKGRFGALTDTSGRILYTREAIDLNKWTHFICVLNSTDSIISIYKDGVLSNSRKTKPVNTNNGYPLVFGRHYTNSRGGGGFEYPFRGKIDDIRIFNYALDSTKIEELYHEGGWGKFIYYDSVTVYDTIPIYDTISVTDTLLIDVDLSDRDLSNNLIKIYPSDDKKVIHINTGEYQSMKYYTIRIINTKNQVIFQSLINQKEFSINVCEFEKEGLYFVEIYNFCMKLVEKRRIILD